MDVNARTSEYDAIAGNVGVAQASERTVIANSATAKTTIGSSLAFNIANAVVSKEACSAVAGVGEGGALLRHGRLQRTALQHLQHRAGGGDTNLCAGRTQAFNGRALR